ncbi:MAG: hypothetical protein QOE53_1239 [Pseudonocardiales bacterium]|jgi:hypothetical protein|nr:hypothetical protein [Pseudonocardiales bacterium]
MTIRLPLATQAAAAIVLVMLAAGCGNSTPSSAGSDTGSGSTEVAGSLEGSTPTGTAGSTNTAASTGNSPTTTGGSPAQTDSTPAQEGTGAESPQPEQKGGPTISVASLPVGGNRDEDGARQCGHVGLIVHNGLPAGISISIDSIGLSREGIFTLGGDLCAPDSAPCTTTWTWTTDTANKQCAVAVTQVADSEEPVALVLVGTVHCPDQRACDDVQRSFDGNGSDTQIKFEPSLGVVSGGSTPASSGSSAGASPSDSGSSPSGSAETSAATEASTSGS